MSHIPVMVAEVVRFLDPKPNQDFVDCTLGDGGHALAVLERTAPNGKLLGIDADAEAIALVKCQMSNVKCFSRLILAHGNFRNLGAIVKEHSFEAVRGILLDLGFSSSTLERGRGFSFEKDEILDMRFDSSSGNRAAEIVNGWDQRQLAELLQEYGEERLATQIANKIVATRKIAPIVTTKQLAEVVIEAYREKLFHNPPRPSLTLREGDQRVLPLRVRGSERGLRIQDRIPWIGGIHPATRTFQALRIAVNDELNALQEVLPQAVDLLVPGGRLAVISFHSLEDRIVKHFFKGLDKDQIKILTKKPIYAGSEEINNNPKARSAKLRVVEKLEIRN